MWLLIFPVLSYLLFIAHLKFHGMLLWCLVPLMLLCLLMIPNRINKYIQQAALVVSAAEWVLTAYLLYLQRVASGRPFTTAMCILGGVALFTLLSALVFDSKRLKVYYRPWLLRKSGE